LRASAILLLALLAAGSRDGLAAQQPALPAAPSAEGDVGPRQTTLQDYNQRLEQLTRSADAMGPAASAQEYRIGPEDLLAVSVFEAPDLSRTVRVSSGGEIYLPLLGTVRTSGLSPHELELVIEELLRRTYMKDPHVSVLVQEMQSHPVSVFGAVKKPGVFQIREPKTVVEMLSRAEGLADDAGDAVVVMHLGGEPAVPEAGSGPVNPRSPEGSADASSQQISLKDLLESGDSRYNVLVYPGDVVKVLRAGIIYVVGEVKKPGGFELKSNESISVLQALALAEGMTRTSAASQARIIRMEETTGKRTEIRINLGKILTQKAPDPMLQSNDIVFVPNSTRRSAFYRGMETAISIGSGVAIYHW
jgi:polysaccharide biosynthesis/export protein